MKKIINLALFGILGLASSITFAGDNLQSGNQLTAGYYVVVAAFRQGQDNAAQEFTDNINKDGLHADFGFDATRNLIYVYLAHYSDFSESLREMEKARLSGGFPNAWVRVMPGTVEEKVAVAAKPVEEKKVEEKPVATIYVAIPKEVIDQTATNNAVIEVIENPKADPVYLPQTLTNTPIFLSLGNSANGKQIEGDIEVIDTERARSMVKVKSNTYLTLPDPKSKSGQLTLVCNAFGYRKVKHEINYKNTEADTLQPYVDLVGNFYLIKFDLVRYHTGDMSALNGVTFYNDAAIMLPTSKFELNSLLQMMQDNMNYKIMIHGHTNGNDRGNVITMGPSKNFFALTKDVKTEMGSAKDLSRERAQVIKDWLIAQGIGAERINITAWGGSKMIHDKNSVNANQNVRVEVEVVAE